MEVKFFSKEHIIESESISYEQTIRWNNNVSHERDGRKNENQKRNITKLDLVDEKF